MPKNTLLFSLVLLAMLWLPTATFAKEKPIDGLMGMFDTFNTLEEHFRANEWDKATEITAKVEKDYLGMVDQLKPTVDGKLIQKFSFVIKSFAKTLEKKNAEELEKPYLVLQGLFLDIMDYYAYPVSPVLTIANRYVDEAKEAMEKKNFDFAADEMEEIADRKERITKALGEKGVPAKDIGGFFETVEQTEKSAKQKNQAAVTESLESLEKFLAPYLK